MPSHGMQVTGVQDHRRATGIFNNTQSSLAHKAALSNVSARLATIGNGLDTRVYGPSNNFAGRALHDHDSEAKNFTPLAARSAFHAALLCLYAQSSLGGTPGFSTPRQIETDAQNDSQMGVASHHLGPGSTGGRPLAPFSVGVVDTGRRHIAGAGPFEGVGAQPDAPLILSDARPSRSIATYLGQLGNSLMSAGVLGFVRQHPGRAAAISVAAGLGTMAIAKGLGAFSSEPIAFSRVSVVKQLSTMVLPSGETLDNAVRNAIHGCAGNGSCERDAVANLLDPYKEQLGYTAQARDSGSGVFSGAVAMPLIPDLVWDAYIDNIVAAYHQWDAQSFLSDVELISRASTNDDRRDVIVNMLGERGFTPQIRPFNHQPPEWLADPGADPVSGVNIIADVAGPESNTQAPVLLLGAHYDKIGEGSEGAYDNGSGCAVVLELARRFQERPPENCRIKMAFFGEEETGLNGSSALVQECRDEDNCPAMMINIDLAAGGNQIYAGSSSASHLFALLADDPDAVMPMAEQPSETRLLDGMRAAANGSTLKVVQNKGTPASDHLSYQFGGQPAVGISLLKEGQSAEMERIALASAAVKRTSDPIDWALMEPLERELDDALGSDNHDPWRIANARHNYLSEARKQPFQPYIAAIDEHMRAHEESTHLRAMHGANDTLELIRPREVVKFIDVMEQGIRNFCQELPAST